MIRFVTGVIGSGKTYFSLLFIVKNFVKDEELKKKIKKDFQLKNLSFVVRANHQLFALPQHLFYKQLLLAHHVLLLQMQN